MSIREIYNSREESTQELYNQEKFIAMNLSRDVVLSKNSSFRVNSDESRYLRREKCSDSRKQKRADQHKERRSIDVEDDMDCVLDSLIQNVEMMEVSPTIQDKNVKDEWLKLLFSESYYDQLNAVSLFARFLYRLRSPKCIEEIIQLGLLPRFFVMLQSPHPPLQVSSAARSGWTSTHVTFFQLKIAKVLTDITAGQLENRLPGDAIEILTKIMKTTADTQLKVEVLAVFGNITGDCYELRDAVVDSDAFTFILKELNYSSNLIVLRHCTWAMANMGYSKRFSKLLKAVPALIKLIYHFDNEIVGESCSSLAAMCNSSTDAIQVILDSNLLFRLHELLDMRNSSIIMIGALDVIRGISLGTTEQNQALINCGTLDHLRSLLSSKNNSMTGRICSILANIAGETCDQIQAVIDAEFFPILFNLLVMEESETQVECAWVIRHCVSRKRSLPNQIDSLISFGIIQCLVEALESDNEDVLPVVIVTLRNVLLFNDDCLWDLWEIAGGELIFTLFQ